MKIKTPCEICIKLGERIVADNIEGDNFPPEFKQLIKVPDMDDNVFQCPLCETFYLYEHKTDNDVYNLMDFSTLERITGEKLESIKESVRESLEYEKGQVEKFIKEIKRKRGIKKLLTLPTEEKRVVDYLMNKTWNGEYLERIASDLNIDLHQLSILVKSLEENKLIIIHINYPMGLDEHNFRVEIKNVDPIPYTKVTMNYLW